jgi:hypothetical protein
MMIASPPIWDRRQCQRKASIGTRCWQHGPQRRTAVKVTKLETKVVDDSEVQHLVAVGFDLGTVSGIGISRSLPEAAWGEVEPHAMEILDFRLITMHAPEDSTAAHSSGKRKTLSRAGKGDAVRARVHAQEVWVAWAPELSVALGRAKDVASKNGASLLVCYEQVNFAKSVYWAQLYGGMLAILLHTASIITPEARICPINVSRVKSRMTGDSGASELAMRDALRPFIERAPSRTRTLYHDVPMKIRHNIDDALAISFAGLSEYNANIRTTTNLKVEDFR